MLTLSTALLLTAATASAGEDSGFRFGLAGGAWLPDKTESVIDNAWTVVARPGWDFNKTFALELDLAYAQGTSRTSDRLFHVVDPRLNLLVHAPSLGPLTIFGAVGPGLYYKDEVVDPDDPAAQEHDQTNALGHGLFTDTELDGLVNIGPGLLLRLGQSPFGLRTDLRYALSFGNTQANKDDDPTTLENDIHHNWEWTIGLQLRTGWGKKDADGDGILDDVDQCVDDPEDFDDFQDSDGCPDNDNDSDRIPDDADQCRDDAEDVDDFQDEDGCPDPDNDDDGLLDGADDCPVEPGPASTRGCPDRDGDTVVDSIDACPDEAGTLDTNGCPDQDGDRVPDHRDQCPTEPADARVDPARSDGCPARVVVTKDEVVILDKVFFDTGKATIKTASFAILDEVAGVLKSYPDIEQIEVQGHTDAQGSDASNLSLSQRRADSVRQYLIDKGVEPGRLVAKGYGETVPVDTNDTADGRAKNRRVQFLILKQ